MEWIYAGGGDEYWTAGRRVPAGRYQRVDGGSARVVVLEREDWLPASLDGQVAIYLRLPERPQADRRTRVSA